MVLNAECLKDTMNQVYNSCESRLTTPNGKTAVFCVIGDPVSHSMSPQIHRRFADICKINMAYVPFHVKNDNIPAMLTGAHAMGIRGINVTVPHKMAVMPHLFEIDAMAQKVGTVNTLVWTEEGYVGYNTDYIGIQRTIAAQGMTFANQSVAIIGAGGSAYAAAVAAADGDAKKISVINRTEKNALVLASHINKHYNVPIQVDDVESVRFADIVIQTTTVGFGNLSDKSPLPDSSSSSDISSSSDKPLASNEKLLNNIKLAFDIIYTPSETVFMQQAKEAGVPKIVNGLPMLIYQAAESFEIWRKSFFVDSDSESIPNEEIENIIKWLHSN